MRRAARDRWFTHTVAQGREAVALQMPRLASPLRPQESPETTKRMASIALAYERGLPESQARFLGCKPVLPLYPYQETGVALMLRRTEEPLEFTSGEPAVRGGILGDDMRLGKTIETLTFVQLLIQKCVARGESRFGSPILIVVKSDNMDDWLGEMSHVFPAHTMSVLVVNGDTVYDAKHVAQQYDIIITSYSTLALERMFTVLTQQIPYRAVFFDEAHCLVNPTTVLHKIAVAVRSPIKWFVSGTPVQNDAVNDKNAALVVIGVPRSLLTHPSVANTLCERLLIRRDRWSVGLVDPDERMEVIPLTVLPFSSGVEKKLYNGMVDNLAPIFEESSRHQPALMMRVIHTMRKMCATPYLVSDLSSLAALHDIMTAEHPDLSQNREARDIRQLALRNMYYEAVAGEVGLRTAHEDILRQAKIDGSVEQWAAFLQRAESLREYILPPVCTKEKWVVNLLDTVCEPRGEKVVIYSNWVDALERLEGLLHERQRLLSPKAKGCVVVHGGILKKKERRARIEEFKANENVNVLLISIKIGSDGHDFTVANHAVIYDPWWNPNAEFQAVARIVGKKQRRQVHFYRLVLEKTVEVLVTDIADEKARNQLKVTGGGDPMSVDDTGDEEEHETRDCLRIGRNLRRVD